VLILGFDACFLRHRGGSLHHLPKNAEYSLRVRHLLKDTHWFVHLDVVLHPSENPEHGVTIQSPLDADCNRHGPQSELFHSLNDLRSDQQSSVCSC
jgi:hypothetical protein